MDMDSRNFIYDIGETEALEVLGDGLSSKYRLAILLLLSKRSYSIRELLRELDISPSTLSFHLKTLQEANLIKYVRSPSKRGNEKNVSLNVENIHITFAGNAEVRPKHFFENIPIGSYSKYDVTAPCMIATKDGIINPVDSTLVFSSYQRTQAQLIALTKGTLEYNLVIEDIPHSSVSEISFTQEICSECPNYNNSWKSSITFWINGVEIGTFLSLGDYGGRKGNYSPDWWPIKSTNYGVLVNVTVNETGSYINGEKVSNITVKELKFSDSQCIKYKLGVKENTKYAGGMNIFGKYFGDYDQDIIASITLK